MSLEVWYIYLSLYKSENFDYTLIYSELRIFDKWKADLELRLGEKIKKVF